MCGSWRKVARGWTWPDRAGTRGHGVTRREWVVRHAIKPADLPPQSAGRFSAGSMPAQRLRRWAGIEPALTNSGFWWTGGMRYKFVQFAGGAMYVGGTWCLEEVLDDLVAVTEGCDNALPRAHFVVYALKLASVWIIIVRLLFSHFLKKIIETSQIIFQIGLPYLLANYCDICVFSSFSIL